MRWMCVAVLAAVLFTCVQAMAADRPAGNQVVLWGDLKDKPSTNAADYNPTEAEIRIGDVLFMVLRTPAAGYTVAEREAVILKRIVAIYASGKIAPVAVTTVRGRPTISVNNIRLVTVYPRDVRSAADGDVWSLARHWAEGIREGLLLTAPSNCFREGPTYAATFHGKPVCRLLEPDSFANVRQRGLAVDSRLSLIEADFDAGMLGTEETPGGTVVTYDGRPLVTATALDARGAAYPSSTALAAAWIDRIKLVAAQAATCVAPAP
jgi:hypothetical protein